MQKYLSCEDRVYYFSISTTNSTFMDFFSNGTNIILLGKLFYTRALLPNSDVFTPSLNTVSPHPIFPPRVIMAEIKSLLSL